MAQIEKSVTGSNRVTVTFYLNDRELGDLEAFRDRTENWLRDKCSFPLDDDYTLDDAVLYIVGEVLSGRSAEINMVHAFSD